MLCKKLDVWGRIIRIWTTYFFLVFVGLVSFEQAKANNTHLCDPSNPVPTAILSQYGIDESIELYQNRTSDIQTIVPLRNRTQTIQEIINSAEDGSLVVFEPGFYDVQGTIEINKPLTIAAQNHWLSSSTGRTRLLNTRFKINADNVSVEGFEFRYGYKTTDLGNSRDGAIDINGDYSKIHSNRFTFVGVNSIVPDNTGITIQINGVRGTQIENNSFEVNHGIAIKTDDLVKETIIRRNDFLRTSEEFWLGSPANHPTAGEVAHLGNSLTNFDGDPDTIDSQGTLFERNLVIGWQVEMELVSIKSDFNVIQHNLGIDNGIGSFVVRMGHNNLIRENILIDTAEQPLRISGSGNRFENNFFAVKNEGEGYLLALHRQMRYPNSTFPDCGFGCFSYLAARMNTLINNTFVGYGDAVIWPDITQQERLYIDGNVDFVPGDPLTEKNLFVENSVYASNPNPLKDYLDSSSAIENVSSTFSNSWDCAVVPNFHLP